MELAEGKNNIYTHRKIYICAREQNAKRLALAYRIHICKYTNIYMKTGYAYGNELEKFRNEPHEKAKGQRPKAKGQRPKSIVHSPINVRRI